MCLGAGSGQWSCGGLGWGWGRSGCEGHSSDCMFAPAPLLPVRVQRCRQGRAAAQPVCMQLLQERVHPSCTRASAHIQNLQTLSSHHHHHHHATPHTPCHSTSTSSPFPSTTSSCRTPSRRCWRPWWPACWSTWAPCCASAQRAQRRPPALRGRPSLGSWRSPTCSRCVWVGGCGGDNAWSGWAGRRWWCGWVWVGRGG